MSLTKIKLVLLDVDGVLTDGTLWIGERGEAVKSFHVRDGYGVKALQRNGIEVGVISGRSCPALKMRLQELGITLAYLGVTDKLSIYKNILAEKAITDAEVAYMGDDFPDIAVMRRVGYPCAPADAAPEVKSIARFIAPMPGGKGAVRALAEAILKARQQWGVPCGKEKL